MKLEQKIEAILFFKNEAISVSELVKILKSDEEKIKEAINELKIKLENRGIVILEENNKIILGTNSELDNIIEKIEKDEEEKELSKSTIETLTIILYKGKILKPELDYIRGVNSYYTLRNLLIRGLVEKKENEEDRRSPFYIPTMDTLAFLGIKKKEDLPEFEKFNEKFKEIKIEE